MGMREIMHTASYDMHLAYPHTPAYHNTANDVTPSLQSRAYADHDLALYSHL